MLLGTVAGLVEDELSTRSFAAVTETGVIADFCSLFFSPLPLKKLKDFSRDEVVTGGEVGSGDFISYELRGDALSLSSEDNDLLPPHKPEKGDFVELFIATVDDL